MPHRFSRAFLRTCISTASVFLCLSSAGFADVIATSAAAPPANSVYTLSPTCVSVLCLDNIQLSNFNTTSRSISGGNELTISNVDLTANAFQNVGGSAGPFVNTVLLTGQVDITYFSKPLLDELGTFSTQITSLNLSGTFIGLTGPHTLDAMLDPNQLSTGETSITRISLRPEMFQFSSFFDVFPELSIDGGSFVPGPERVATLVETPEPGYLVPLGIGFAILALFRFAGPKRLSADTPVS